MIYAASPETDVSTRYQLAVAGRECPVIKSPCYQVHYAMWPRTCRSAIAMNTLLLDMADDPEWVGEFFALAEYQRAPATSQPR